jgi:hypothetical protein
MNDRFNVEALFSAAQNIIGLQPLWRPVPLNDDAAELRPDEAVQLIRALSDADEWSCDFVYPYLWVWGPWPATYTIVPYGDVFVWRETELVGHARWTGERHEWYILNHDAFES